MHGFYNSTVVAAVEARYYCQNVFQKVNLNPNSKEPGRRLGRSQTISTWEILQYLPTLQMVKQPFNYQIPETQN